MTCFLYEFGNTIFPIIIYNILMRFSTSFFIFIFLFLPLFNSILIIFKRFIFSTNRSRIIFNISIFFLKKICHRHRSSKVLLITNIRILVKRFSTISTFNYTNPFTCFFSPEPSIVNTFFCSSRNITFIEEPLRISSSSHTKKISLKPIS